MTIPSQSVDEQLGFSVLVLDFDDDGTPGVVVGAMSADAGGTDRGRVYWFDAPLSDQTVDETMSGSQDNERYGYTLAGGKFSSDSRTIVVIGANWWDKPGGGGTDNDGRVVVGFVPEMPLPLVGAVLVLSLAGASLQRRRLVRKR